MRELDLLCSLIATPSVSRSEGATADLIFNWLADAGASPQRLHNNVWAFAGTYDPSRPTLLLNSHHDTVRPADGYRRDPYTPSIEDGCLYGLGSNDAGGSVAALTATFLALRTARLPFNLILAVTAEEEVGGENGMRAFLPHMRELGVDITCAIVGEPTSLQAAVAERGLIVLDAVTQGVAGHAARGEGVNALYRAIDDINALRALRFDRESAVLGPIGVNVTMISAGKQHNSIPDECRWVVDVRTTDAYTPEETAAILHGAVSHSTLTPRSFRVRPSVITEGHPLVQGALRLGLKTFVSPTTSDMSLMYDFPSLKLGPGDSSRSHRADEWIAIADIEKAVSIYTDLIINLNL